MLANSAAVLFDGAVFTSAAAGSSHTSSNSADSACLGIPILASGARNGSFQCVWASLTGTLDAAFQVEVSNDGSTWDPKSGASLTVSGASGHDTLALNGVICEKYYRIVYTHNNVSGGTVNCRALLKG